MKRILVILIAILLLLPVALGIGIGIANDRIAARVETQLKQTPLPQDTVLLDSISIAGKLVGNGNGMQYMGSILVTNALSKEALQAYYRQKFQYIEVREQNTPVIDFINSPGYRFELYADSNHQTHYSITCWGSRKDMGISDFAATLLDFDLRGH